ncbi:hypothetical protein C9374_013933 [Naegleria lovaniensis]|uniref:F-box domain-containing protein n=1 Tax=Naegleria lovaniensis TaxID=51637 RepID=A0AA88GZQ2_NAELO|nr:uncharacterized protein C9374_013933 [Naegleria lovaniensis]KAG2389373.1 hypothetical protein C9374_013933 [Naegleria lovaniensis]
MSTTNYKEMGDHQKYHQTLEFITKSLSVESPSGDTRVCPFCLQNTCVDQLSEHVAYCMSIWNSLFSNDSDLFVEENQSENSEKKRKLFSLDAADAMSLNPTKKKKNYQNKMRPHPLLEELGDDMIRHFLSFMENKFLIGVCMRVSKHWLEIIRTIPIEFTLDIKEQLSSVLQIVSNPSGLCLTKLELPFEYSNLCCIPMTNNKNLDRLQTFILHELQSKYFVNSLIESSYMGNLRELTLKHCQHFGNDILAALCTSTYLQSLTSLTIESGNITADGLSVLKSNPPIMRNLTTLGLNFNPCRDRGASVHH